MNRDIDHRVYSNRGISWSGEQLDHGIFLCATKRMTTLLKNCKCGGHLSLQTDGNLHDLHIRDIDHLVRELQQGENYGLLNSKTMGISFCTTTGNIDDHEGLQLRKLHSMLQSEPWAP